jgi:hypothetical protein
VLEGVDQTADLSETVRSRRSHSRYRGWIVTLHRVHCLDTESGRRLKLGQPHDSAFFSNRPNELKNVGDRGCVVRRFGKSMEIRFAFRETL